MDKFFGTKYMKQYCHFIVRIKSKIEERDVKMRIN